MQWYLKAPSLVRDDTLPYYFNPSIRSFHQQNQWHWQLTPDPDSSWTHRPLASFPCFEVQAFPHLPGWQAPPVPSNSEHCRRASACGIITTTAAAQSQTDQIQTDTQPNDPQKKMTLSAMQKELPETTRKTMKNPAKETLFAISSSMNEWSNARAVKLL